MKFFPRFILLALIAISCNQRPEFSSNPNVPHRVIYNAHFMQVWEPAMKMLTSFKIPVQILDIETGLAVSEMIDIPENQINRVCDRRDDRWHGFNQSRVQLTLHVKEVRDSVTQILMNIQPYSYSSIQEKWIELTSNGKMEEEIRTWFLAKGLTEIE